MGKVMKEYSFNNIAVLIDAENISPKYLEKIFESIAAYGRISVRRVYSDWTDERNKSWKKLIQEYSLVTIQQFSNIHAKNVSDFTLVIDAMDLLHEGLFDCFCIVSSDSDFTRLVQKIKEKGRTVVGLGEKKSIDAFVKACNDFIYLDEKSLNDDALDEPNAGSIKTKTDSIDALMNKAIKNLQDQEGKVQMNAIVPYLKQIRPDFDLSSYKTDDGNSIGKLSTYFKGHNRYALNKDNTVVWRK
ncbi:MAG: NYN domain-containing protein [Clostridiales Family XIII bacterium]|nr:NYN domain-containing protein [Clostridiales Family XIII bacterium]